MTDSVNPNADDNISVSLLPRIYRTDANKKFLHATVEQLTHRGSVTKINGYIGRQNAKAASASDIFIKEPSTVRQNYQLEPSLVVNDQYNENIFFKDYQDYINKINLLDGNTTNHARLNNEESYSWDPRIDWDKFTNFHNYYWVSSTDIPNTSAYDVLGNTAYTLLDGSELYDGMLVSFSADSVFKSQYYVSGVGSSIKLIDSTITITGNEVAVYSSFDINVSSIGNTVQYVFTPDGITTSPIISLYRGQTYTFHVNTPGYPVSIMSARSTDPLYRVPGASAYKVESGSFTFTITDDTPAILYYQCETDISIGGLIQVSAVPSYINVSESIIGKSNFTLPNGVSLSNGMVVSFTDTAEPIMYRSSTYYVEGVGTAIKLVDFNSLKSSSTKDYIVINRASSDKNPWSLVNRWVHYDTLAESASINGFVPKLNYSDKAQRPIIEFVADLKLFNYGIVSIASIDLIDEFTTDAFSMVEGYTGYIIDGIALEEGHRVMFTAETEVSVNGNVYRVSFVDSKIHLILEVSPEKDDVVSVTNGLINANARFWYDGSKWIQAQSKPRANIAPLFDVVDANGISISDVSVYNGSTFAGTKLFSYKEGTGATDDVLGFSLSYKNINNIGDILFNFDYSLDTFKYKISDTLITEKIGKYYLHNLNFSNKELFSNGWITTDTTVTQPAVQIYKNTGYVNKFPIEMYDDVSMLDGSDIRIYKNGVRLQQFSKSSIYNWVITNTVPKRQLVLLNSDSSHEILSTSAIDNSIEIASTFGLTIGTSLVFTSAFGGLLTNIVYYIIDIPSITSFVVSTFKSGTAATLTPSTTGGNFQILSDITVEDVITIKVYSKNPINSNGFYETPANLQNNPLNDTPESFTLGEVMNHVDTIVDNLSSQFVGEFPGIGNLRDIGNASSYGTKFIKHSGPFGLAMYHVTSDIANVYKAVIQSRDDYSRFKRNFIMTAETLGLGYDIKSQVDEILQYITKNNPKSSPYYFSDMAPFGPSVSATYTITDYPISQYPLQTPFNLLNISNLAVGVYINGDQLLVEHDYIFDNQGFISISAAISPGDVITIHEYENTDGCFIPETPTKLGIWPKSDPKIFKDTSLINPRWMIQGHDGSLVLAYGDYDQGGISDVRDYLILELEKRIYNNIKVKYDADIFDISKIVSTHGSLSDYSMTEINSVLAPHFYQWAANVDVDFSEQLGYNHENPFTYNYRDYTYNYTGHENFDDGAVPGGWRGIYKWLLGTDRPQLCPWEILRFIDKPSWWESAYGPAPYTSDNLIMWQDISDGIVRDPSTSAYSLQNYDKSFIIDNIPVDESGNIKTPISAGYVVCANPNNKQGFVFGDIGTVETAWRRSSYFPYSAIVTSIVLNPVNTIGTIYDKSRIARNACNQLIYTETGTHLTASDVLLPSIYNSEKRVQTAGLVNFIINKLVGDNLANYDRYLYDIRNIAFRLSYRVGAFTSKAKFNLLLESKSPVSTGSVFIPKDDYNIILNTSVPISKITYSGVIITKLPGKFSVSGYSKTQAFFNYYDWKQTGSSITIGGISENYVIWTSGQAYIQGQIVKYNNGYYRVKGNTTKTSFISQEYIALSSLPIVGGKTAYFRKEWDKSSVISIPYNTTFDTIQEVVDFLLGYGEWLTDQGFVFDEYNNNLNQVLNWETSAKEFLFWTTQNWSSGSEAWSDWSPNTAVTNNTIVKYFDDYYRAIRNIDASPIFDYVYYVKLDGLSSVGSSVISLSPGATKLSFTKPLHVVDDIGNSVNDYEIYRVDGKAISPKYLNSARDENLVSYSPNNDDGIYNASFYLIQKEHVVIINNTTQFNDLIYSPISGYKQDMIKVSAYVSSGWYGGLDIQGFISDEATTTAWKPWTDYNLGDVVQYQSLYYSANGTFAGTEKFVSDDWLRIAKKPSARIIPNWTNLATQIEDFYNLETDSFDDSRQVMAQHLIGYQKRQYLNNIIQDDVSEFKFYQGMISEKGTANGLNKLFSVLGNDNKETVSFTEEWAIRTGDYGATAAFNEYELVLSHDTVKYNPQAYEMVEVRTRENDFIIQQTPRDMYVKPIGYNSTICSLSSSTTQVFRSAGYVRESDVFLTLASIDELLTQDITTFSEGNYIWCTFEGASWNVYRYTIMHSVVTGISYDGVLKKLTINYTELLPYTVGEYIGVTISSPVTGLVGLVGFYKIETTNSTTIVTTELSKSVTIPSSMDFTQVTLYKLKPQRVPSIDDANSAIYTVKDNELLWTDDSGSGKWACWINSPAFSNNTFRALGIGSNANFGRCIASDQSDQSGSTVAVSTRTGFVIIYDRVGNNSRNLVQRLRVPEFSDNYPNTDEMFGISLAMSADGAWLAVGSPNVGHVATANWNGRTFDSTTAVFGDLTHTFDDDNTGVIPPNNDIIKVDLLNGVDSSFTQQGVVTLYRKDVSTGLFQELYSFVSKNAATNEKFGTSVVFGDGVMYVGSPGSASVYTVKYKTILGTTATYIPLGSDINTIKLTSTYGITPGMYIEGTGFTRNQRVLSVIDDSTITLISPPNSTPNGTLRFVNYVWEYGSVLTGATSSEFGSQIDISKDTSTVAVYSKDTDPNFGVIHVYSDILHNINTGGDYNYSFSSSIYASLFSGKCFSLSSDGSYIAVSDSDEDDGVGIVIIYHRNEDTTTVSPPERFTYFIEQNLDNEYLEVHAYFGTNISFMDDDSLVIHSNYTDLSSGQIDIYDRYKSKWIYSERLKFPTVNALLDNAQNHALGFFATATSVFVGEPADLTGNGIVTEFFKKPNTQGWSILHEELPKPDVYKIKKAFLYNKKSNKLITHLDVIDPLQGKIAGPAEEEINFKHFYDPAIYSTGTGIVNVDESVAWTSEQVGKLWWDLRTAKFVESFDTVIDYRSSTWNLLAHGASIDIYEWVEYTNKPSAWDAIADTNEGLSKNISGTSLYGDSVYSTKSRFDEISKTTKTTYYFWVKNKTITPAINGRSISAASVSNLISDPIGAAYQSISFTSVNSFLIGNVAPLLDKTDVVLSIQSWVIDNTDQNIHSQWKLLSDDGLTLIPAVIEQKWIDSLCGLDTYGRAVPDVTLSVKLQYGVQNRPRQGMFVNRFEALKQFVDQLNLVLSNNQISFSRDLTALSAYDSIPEISSGLYDIAIDTDSELAYVNAAAFKQAVLTPVIIDGRIVSVTIESAGAGYVHIPKITISGSGNGAILSIDKNAAGQITNINVIDGGSEYTESTFLTVRSYAVLVKNDTTSNGSWSIYEYSSSANDWHRILTKSYDNTKFWQYVDWYETGYDQYTSITAIVDTYADLNASLHEFGDIVKVKIGNNGGWVLLIRTDSTSIDYADSLFSIIGVQQGTIQIKSNIYTNYAYDDSLYDSVVFDDSPGVEIRNILLAFKQDILIDELSAEYIKLFFNSIRYVLSEQTYVDWVFKSSFMKATHKIGSLTQAITYTNDNLVDFENYINEVKPYRTKVREYISAYDKLDTSYTSVSDFDLPVVYKDGVEYSVDTWIENNQIHHSSNIIDSYPWKSWHDHVGFEVVSIMVTQPGSGYSSAPSVEIIGGGGSGAIAYAIVPMGEDYVNEIVIVNSGKRYVSAPTVVISPPNGPYGATAVAYIGNSIVRTTAIDVKFDRISSNYFIPALSVNDIIISSGIAQYELKWSPDITMGNSTVSIDGIALLPSEYILGTNEIPEISSKYSYSRQIGYIELTTVPVDGAIIEISYRKNISILNAADRIQHFYNPGNNFELGKDLAQLMSGIDYGGVIVNGLSFTETKGWDSLPFMADRWDSYDPLFTDVTIVLDEITHTFTVPYVLDSGVYLTIYQNGVRLDDEFYGTVNQINGLAIMQSPSVASGVIIDLVNNTSTFNIPSLQTVNIGDIFIIRKSTSDGSQTPLSDNYDAVYNGGDLMYTTATGFSPSDLIVDGDGFVTPMTSHAPEEVVPGQLVDAVSIKVHEQSATISGNVKVTRHIADGMETVFSVGEILNSDQSIIVIIETTTEVVISTNYVLNFNDSTVSFSTPPAENSAVIIYSIGVNATGVLETGEFIGDGITSLYRTTTAWSSDITRVALVEISGVVQPHSLVNNGGVTAIQLNSPVPDGSRLSFILASDMEIGFFVGDGIENLIVTNTIWDTSVTRVVLVEADGVSLPYTLEQSVNNLAIRLSSVPLGTVVNYVIINSAVQTFTITTSQRIFPNGGSIYQLANGIGDTLPNDSFIVILDQIILASTEYTVTAKVGSTPASITFNQAISPLQSITVFSSYVNSILGTTNSIIDVTPTIIPTVDTVEYFQYQSVKGGVIKLNNSVINENYIWVIKNGVLLAPVIDFVLLDDLTSIKLKKRPKASDVFRIITFASNTTSSASYMQFKDMLNRMHYKELSTANTTSLTAPLLWSDDRIYVDNVHIFDVPDIANNIPGIVEIGSERIEYFEFGPNYLTHLRRATMGTGAASSYPIGTAVQNIGPSTTISYNDKASIQHVIVNDSSTLINIDFVPSRCPIINGIRTTGVIVNAGHFVIGQTYIIKSLGDTNFVSIGASSNTINMEFVANSHGSGTGVAYQAWDYNNVLLPVEYGQANDIEVFIGGYNIISWTPNRTFIVGDIIAFGSYLYRTTANFISGTNFTDPVDTVSINIDGSVAAIVTENNNPLSIMEFFVESIRLKKQPYKIFNVNTGQYSPSGDVQFDADFTVDGVNSQIRLNNPVPVGTRLTVVRSTGSQWKNTKYYINLD